MSTDERTRPFRSLAELVDLIERFERTNLPREQWNHRAHLAVALWYFMHLDECAATDRVITGIRRYNRAQGIKMTPSGGYHETLTLFWLALAKEFLCSHPDGDALKRVNKFVRAFGNRGRLFLEYYSAQRIMSWSARCHWMEPDLQPLAARAGLSGRAG